MPRILVAGPCAALPAQPEWHGGMGTWARPQFEIEARQPEPELSSASPSPAPPGPGPAPLVTAAAPPPLHAPAGRWCLLLARSQFSAEPQHWQSAALVYCALAMSFGRVAGGRLLCRPTPTRWTPAVGCVAVQRSRLSCSGQGFRTAVIAARGSLAAKRTRPD